MTNFVSINSHPNNNNLRIIDNDDRSILKKKLSLSPSLHHNLRSILLRKMLSLSLFLSITISLMNLTGGKLFGGSCGGPSEREIVLGIAPFAIYPLTCELFPGNEGCMFTAEIADPDIAVIDPTQGDGSASIVVTGVMVGMTTMTIDWECSGILWVASLIFMFNKYLRHLGCIPWEQPTRLLILRGESPLTANYPVWAVSISPAQGGNKLRYAGT